jgi:DNA-damage-inducible protein J
MAKTANVNARVEENIKKEAESILADMGIPVSVGINMFYRQVIYCHGLPFRPIAKREMPRSLSDMSREEFDARMAAGVEDAKAGREMSADDAFDRLIKGVHNRETVNG